jgi:hypothetical protein
MKIIEYTLPEFVFLDGNSHLGDTLQYRTVIQHIRTNTVMEVIAQDDVIISDFSNSKCHHFNYLNHFGINEKHILVVHFTFATDLPDVFQKTVAWYTAYLRWEDRNIQTDSKSAMN